ncbi:MAG: M4 family metallopeptidase [Bacteroidota bacterium]
MNNTRNPILCIIPPHMLEKIIEKGNEKMRYMALKTLERSNHIRMERSLIQEHPFAHLSAFATASQSTTAKCCKVYDAHHTDDLPGDIARSDGDPPTGDTAIDEAFDGGTTTYKFYLDNYGRNSIDDNGMCIIQTVHYGEDYNNAFWNGRQMVYGDGDDELFTRFTLDLDIIGHELTHGVIQHEANLRYMDQSGALNESYADVFGSLVKQYKLGQKSKEADWLIGKQVLKGGKYALRSMKAPGTAYKNHPVLGDDPQPATMDDYYDLPAWQDNGGVHLNSGIPNHAFYLAAVNIGGNAWEKAGLIWYIALTDVLRSNTTFSKTAYATIRIAQQKYGKDSLEAKAVKQAWRDVKVI